MSAFQDLVGNRYGRLVVVERAPDRVQANGRHRIMWLCKCDCGNTVEVLGDNLKKGVSRSCGCYRHDTLSSSKATHGQTETKLYKVWRGIKTRCYNSRSQYFARYGGRGIVMCDAWRDDFVSFCSWAELSGYRDGFTIDRIDNDGIYSPENCRWVDMKAQANNRHSNVLITLGDETHNITEWAGIIGVSPKTLFSRYYSGKSPEDILKK